MLHALPILANPPKPAVILLEDQHVAQLQVHVAALMMNIAANLDINVYVLELAQDLLAVVLDVEALDNVNNWKAPNLIILKNIAILKYI